MTTTFYTHHPRPRPPKHGRPGPTEDRFDIFGEDAELGSGNDTPSARLLNTDRVIVKMA